MTIKIISTCKTCGHNRSSHVRSGKHFMCKGCNECAHYTCSFCGLVDATGRTSEENYRSHDFVASDKGLMKVLFSGSKKYGEYLMFHYWQKLECGCWVELDVRTAFGVDQEQWNDFCLSADGNTCIKRLQKVSELWEKTVDELVASLNVRAIKGEAIHE